MINLTIDNDIYHIPTGWDEVSIGLYSNIKENYTSDTTVAELLYMLAKIPQEYSDLFDDKQLMSILYRLNFLNEQLVKIDTPTFEDYHLVDINKMTVGEWVDFESKLKMDDADNIIHNLLSVIVRKENIEYDSNNNSVRADHFYNNMDVVSAISYLNNFMVQREYVYSSYKDLFESNEEDDTGGSKNVVKWGWIGFLFDLCDKDITKLEEISKMSILLALNWSLYQVDMIKNLKQ